MIKQDGLIICGNICIRREILKLFADKMILANPSEPIRMNISARFLSTK